MTTWTEHLVRLRRYLRDPDGNLWSDALLLRVFNDSQRDIQRQCNLLTKVASLIVPPSFNVSYLFVWETAHCGQTSGTYRALHEYQQTGAVFCYPWEAQSLSGNAGSETTEGAHFTHPWEALVTSTADPMPIPFPDDFDQARWIAWNQVQIEYTTLKAIQNDDLSYRTHSGEPQYYYRPDAVSNFFCLYPLPDSEVWDQASVTDIDSQTGDTVTIDADDTVLLVYDAIPDALTTGSSVSQLPAWMLKYVEYGALERAYTANTDGKIGSLRDYWQWRKKLAIVALKQFKAKRLTDRDYRLRPGGGSSRLKQRHARLPSKYADTFI